MKINAFYKETAFKETPIGKIPKDWEVVRLGDKNVAVLIMGQSPPSSTYNKEGVGLPFLQGKGEFGEIYPSPILYCSKPIKIAESNDILLSVRAPVGDVNIAPLKCCIGRGLSAIRAKSDKLHYLFLFYYLKFGSKRFESLSMGSTFKAIRKAEIENYKIPLPPLSEQQQIAEILSTVDEAAQKVDEVIAKTERLKRGLMQEYLTKGVNLFNLKKEKILNCVKKCIENKDHKFGREENLSHHLAEYLRKEFPNYNVDVEVEKTDRLRPDIIVHKRHTEQNLFAIEVKKDWNIEEIEEDVRKLEEIMLSGYNYCEAIFIGFNVRNLDSVFKLSNRVNFVLVNPEGEIKVKIRERELKETKIGKIPKGWKVVRLGEVGIFQYGLTASAKKEDTGVKLLRITDIKEGRVVDWLKVPYVELSDLELKKYELKVGDVLFTRIGATTGKTCYIDRPIRGVFGSYLIRFQPSDINTHTKFLYYYTQSKMYWLQVYRIREGQLKKGLNLQLLRNLRLPLPSLPEQQKIVEVLSTVDKKLGIERIEKAKLERIKQRMMDLLLTGKIRVKVN